MQHFIYACKHFKLLCLQVGNFLKGPHRESLNFSYAKQDYFIFSKTDLLFLVLQVNICLISYRLKSDAVPKPLCNASSKCSVAFFGDLKQPT